MELLTLKLVHCVTCTLQTSTLCYLHTTNSSRSNLLNGLSNSHSISHSNTVSTISRTVHQDIDMRSTQRIDLHNRIQSLCLNIFSQSNKNCLQVVIWTNLRQPTHNKAWTSSCSKGKLSTVPAPPEIIYRAFQITDFYFFFYFSISPLC